MECHQDCACPRDQCPGRQVQDRSIGPGMRLFLAPSTLPGCGWGLFTSCPIPRGEFVCTYTGVLLSSLKAGQDYSSLENPYLLTIREHLGDGTILQTRLDAQTMGNVGRFLNHHCSPNLELHAVRTHLPIPQAAFFSNRPILAGEELFWDYGGGEARGEEWVASTVICQCGFEACQGTLPRSTR
ncbi:MAG: hypothetical protein DHS80DRAFT_31417 [Piptocephalis tieghemiana]|nr:MAG: hypothetical protein DHS80DRAFT_31417 [Piptocephalis tieghemiana]